MAYVGFLRQGRKRQEAEGATNAEALQAPA
jgi:hypothetical protein